jgi:hypothetical protein
MQTKQRLGALQAVLDFNSVAFDDSRALDAEETCRNHAQQARKCLLDIANAESGNEQSKLLLFRDALLAVDHSRPYFVPFLSELPPVRVRILKTGVGWDWFKAKSVTLFTLQVVCVSRDTCS